MPAHPPATGAPPARAPTPPETPTGLPPTAVHALHDQAARQTHRPALWTKRGRSWVPTSWHDYARGVRRFARGLVRLGLAPGERVGLQAAGREEWCVTALGSMGAGGVLVGLSPVLGAEALAATLAHVEAVLVVVEDGAGLAQLQALRGRLPALRHVVVLDPPGGALPEGVLAWGDVTALGTNQDEGPYWDRVNALRPEALAALVPAAEAAGPARTVMLSHHNLVWTAARLARTAHLTEDDTVLSTLPLEQLPEQLVSLYGHVLVGGQVSFAENAEALPPRLREVRPTFLLGDPHTWARLAAQLEEAQRARPVAQQRVHAWARAVALDRHRRILAHERVPGTLEAQYQAAHRLVLGPQRARLGLERAHLLVASAPIGRELLERLVAQDLVVHEAWGQPETTGLTTLSTRDATRLGLVGRPMPGVEVRVAASGEVLVRGPNVCLGLLGAPEATRALVRTGWLHTGATGRLDADGYLQLTARPVRGRKA